MAEVERTQVAIVGAGPAGLMLGALLHQAGVEAVVLELRDRHYVEHRIRAGMLEQGTVDLLGEVGVDRRLREQAFRHDSFEVRFGGQRHHVPMADLTCGRSAWMYGQQEVVKDLIADRERRGAPLRFEVADVRLEGIETDAPSVRYRHEGVEQELRCDVIAGCDGFHGVCRPSIPAGALRTFSREYPFGWLGILVDAPPRTTEELIYAHHPHGFALHSFRSTEVSRMYLQVLADEDLARWPDARIWEELHARFVTDDGWTPNVGAITQRGVTAMRSFVSEPMRHGSLFLAGDAAHIVPPTAAKGLNLAMADVCLLADGLAAALRGGDRTLLDAYSGEALRRVWRVQEFSRVMTTMFHHEPGEPFEGRLQRAQLERTVGSEAAMTTFCDDYTGLPFAGRDRAAGAPSVSPSGAAGAAPSRAARSSM